MVAAQNGTKPFTSWPGSQWQKEEGAGSHNSFQALRSLCFLVPTRLKGELYHKGVHLNLNVNLYQ